jgi:hypothetical protein
MTYVSVVAAVLALLFTGLQLRAAKLATAKLEARLRHERLEELALALANLKFRVSHWNQFEVERALIELRTRLAGIDGGYEAVRRIAAMDVRAGRHFETDLPAAINETMEALRASARDL